MAFRLLMGVMAAAFAVAALLQYNDADALRWILIYGAASLLSGVAAVHGRAPLTAAVGLAAVATAWALVLMADLPGLGVYAHMLDAWRMQSPGVEEARESMGLLLVAGCCAVIGMASRRPSRE